MIKFSNITKEMRKTKGGKWNVDLAFVLTFYDAYVREKNLARVSRVFEMTPQRLLELVEKHPELQQARDMADANRGQQILGQYAIQFLSPEARKTWDQIVNLDDFNAIKQVFSGKGIKLKQQIFCQALLHTGFNSSRACHMSGITFRELQNWKADFDFNQMLEDIQFHKKNFFEGALTQLVEERHPAAVMFVNRTINADRGYGEKIQIEETGGGHSQWDLSDLDLDLVTMKKVLAAIDAHKEKIQAKEAKGLKRVTAG